MKEKYRVIYKVRNADYWDIWKNNISTYDEAKQIRLQVVKIFGTPARIQFINK